MLNNKVIYPPFVRAKDSVWEVMSDVLLALVPCAVISYFAYGAVPFGVMLVAIVSALIAEWIFAGIFLKKWNTLLDGSAVVTAVLLSFTLAPFTPWYVVAFGSAMAVIFGKILWGGLGRNRLNPALVGREFMTAFFPLVMTSSSIWYHQDYVNFRKLNLFDFLGEGGFTQYLNTLLFKPSGAIGEYSVILLVLGGLYLLLRRRISWHIPFGLLVTFFVLLQLFSLPQFTFTQIQFSLGGVLLGTLFMATDMPSSASTNMGKLYYGAMIGVVAMICILSGVKHEYMSYSILLVNGFVVLINRVFKSKVWGETSRLKQRTLGAILLTVAIFATTWAVVVLHHYGLIPYLVFAYIVFVIVRFSFSKSIFS